MEEFIVILLLLPGLVFLIAIVWMMLTHRGELTSVRRGGTCNHCGCSIVGNNTGKCPGCGERIRPFTMISDGDQSPE